MSIWYAFCDFLPLEMLHWDFMKNAMLAVLLMGPLFGLCSTMVVTGRMSFFSDALGHSAFTGIAIGSLAGLAAPTWAAVVFSVCFALLFSYVRSRSNQTTFRHLFFGKYTILIRAKGISFYATGKSRLLNRTRLPNYQPTHLQQHATTRAVAAGHKKRERPVYGVAPFML